ncbi:virulence factor family protein [Pseudomonas sp. Gutcm_11s]|uniref:virulence factor family protein n=1 Tax=Pseudomonas sp. Gutcm_11s TaxID=3026088 RepID=UPI00235EF176|nr:AcvB/VirJ family lysyl-phosphatidylglycerol hydrolase [Pseudomonas sp. Gutcm_11s]MDD0841394.1 virulence factor family protein [Pseudomonas sp. Gutcm_11s]
MKRTLLIALPLLAVLSLTGGGAWYYSQYRAVQQSLPLASGGELNISLPAGRPPHRVLLALPADQLYSDAELADLAAAGQTRIAQYAIAENASCEAQRQRLDQALEQFGGTDLVAGSGPGAVLAWRWLASQPSDQAKALSVDFNMKHPDCNAVLPQELQHGHWLVAWNNNPDDSSARFVRGQPNTETLIGDYATSLKDLLHAQLLRTLQANPDALPVVEVTAAKPSDTVTLFYSGDGGWRDLDRDVATELAKRDYPVVGIDSLRYFWQHKSPEAGAADLAGLMQTYREKWGAKRFVLIGFSFGADTLPAFYNRLDAADQQQVDAIILLALARSGSFEIEVQGWLGKDGKEAPTGPELLKLPAAKVLCVYGVEEGPESGCTLPNIPGEMLQLPGGHHYDGDYPKLAERLLQGIQQRQQSAAQ